MKYLFLFLTLLLSVISYGQVGIGTTNPDASSALEIESTNTGLLIPRINITNLSTAAPVTSPSTSLMVYNTNVSTGVGYYYWNGSIWVKLVASTDASTGDNDWYEDGTSTAPNAIGDDIYTEGNVEIESGWLSVGANETSITRYGVYETTWRSTSVSFDDDGYRYFNIGNFNYPTNGLPGSVVVTKMVWEMEGYHEDANEDHGVWIKIGTGTAGPWYGWAGNAGSGAKDISWHYVSGNLGNNRNRGTTIRMRVEDEDCFICGNDEMRVFNMHIKFYYRYSQALQDGDIAANGRVYANSNTDVGDLAEYFEVANDYGYSIGDIITLKANNAYELANKPYAQHIVGVISENPSVVLNNPNVGPPVALAGRVKVKLKPSKRLIKSGDFLTTSNEQGAAMLAEKAGPVIGYAVKDQKANESFVEILVQPGRFYMPNNQE